MRKTASNDPLKLHHRTYYLGPEHDWVVFVHGAGGSSSIWFRQVRAYAEHFNVLMVDLRGHGKSQVQKGNLHFLNYTFEDISSEVVDVLDDLNIEKAHFIGISLGSIIIRTLSEIAPDRVASIVLGGAVVRLNFRSRFLVGVGQLFKRVIPYLWLYSLFAWIIMPRRRHRKSRLLFINEAKKLCQKEFIRWFKLTSEVNPLLRFFREKEMPVPTLYLMGDEDHLFLPPVKALVSRHKHSVLQIIQDSGHVCNVDQPEEFNRRSIAFIKAHPYVAV
ncbi:MAG: alpha/beta hydrolase [Bacteroidota bacterium]